MILITDVDVGKTKVSDNERVIIRSAKNHRPQLWHELCW